MQPGYLQIPFSVVGYHRTCTSCIFCQFVYAAGIGCTGTFGQWCQRFDQPPGSVDASAGASAWHCGPTTGNSSVFDAAGSPGQPSSFSMAPLDDSDCAL